ncbi:MAG TPA: hypothetical protein VH740_20360 [Vicinamibacterales bacterium]|jgi:hypothetical protein
MPQLHIALQEGFGGDPVAIFVDGREVYRKDQVRTRTQIGLADSVQVAHDPGTAKIDIRVGKKSASFTETLTGDLHIGISIKPDGSIVRRASTEAFKYM